MPKKFRIETKEQLEAIVLPIRAEIVELVAALGPLAASDVARMLGKQRPAIHYQVNYLCERGLLEVAGQRGSGRKEEILYRTPGRPMGVVFRPEDAANVELTIAYAKSLLKRAQRVLGAAFRRPGVRTSGKRRNTHATQTTCRLDRHQLEAVNRCIEELRELCSPETLQEDGELFLVTLSLAPLAPAAPSASEDRS